MIESREVLFGQTLVYTCYALIILALMGWFGYKITRPGSGNPVKAGLFYTFVAFLAVLGVSLHIITYNTIPWTPMDLNRANIKADKVFNITVGSHEFHLPSEKMIINCHEKVLFNVQSEDLTYGFGIFRSDNTMVCQMQVVPGHKNDLLWQFDTPGVYSIRSTEYSGPAGYNMVVEDAVEVVASNEQQ